MPGSWNEILRCFKVAFLYKIKKLALLAKLNWNNSYKFVYQQNLNDHLRKRTSEGTWLCIAVLNKIITDAPTLSKKTRNGKNHFLF